MVDSSVNKSIEYEIDKKEDIQPDNTFSMAIQELGESLFENYEDKTSNLSEENITGIIQCRALNDFMHEKYGIRYTVLDSITDNKMKLVISKNGYGISKFIEIVKSIQATFEQNQYPPTFLQKGLGRK